MRGATVSPAGWGRASARQTGKDHTQDSGHVITSRRRRTEANALPFPERGLREQIAGLSCIANRLWPTRIAREASAG